MIWIIVVVLLGVLILLFFFLKKKKTTPIVTAMTNTIPEVVSSGSSPVNSPIISGEFDNSFSSDFNIGN